jgi:hypothetical protein
MTASSLVVTTIVLGTSALVLGNAAPAAADPATPVAIGVSIDHDQEPEIAAPSSQPPSDGGPRTLFEANGRHAFGGFGGLDVAYTRFAGIDASQICGEGAFLVDHALSIGGAGCGIAARIDAQQYGSVIHAPGDRLEFGYGGLALRYHFFAREMFNVSVGTVIGAGAVSITNRAYDDGYHDGHAKSIDAVFVMEPRVIAFLNLTRWARVGVFGGYRIVTGSDTLNLPSSDLGGPTAGGTVQFGWL